MAIEERQLLQTSHLGYSLGEMLMHLEKINFVEKSAAAIADQEVTGNFASYGHSFATKMRRPQAKTKPSVAEVANP